MRELTRRHFLQGALGVSAGGLMKGNSMFGSRDNHPVIVSERIAEDIAPDGNLSKPIWSAAKPVKFDKSAYSETRYPDLETTVASCWTPQFLYLAFWCHYQKITVYQGEDPAIERWRLWERDVAEAFIQPDPSMASHYYEFEVAPNNQWIDLEIDLKKTPSGDPHWNSGFTHATRIDSAARLWTAELRIPVRSMRVDRINPGADWRINFYRCEGIGDNKTRRMFSWGRLPIHSPGSTFHQPGSFGTLRFSKRSDRH